MENHPLPQSMYLSTLPNTKRVLNPARSPLDISDIPGARSRYIQRPRPQRETPSCSFDIEKSQPRQLIPQTVNRPCFLLEVDDIQGTRTQVNKFTTTRQTNPLQPDYQNPRVTFLPPEQPKFIKDSMVIDDIEGVRSRETYAIRLQRAGKTVDTKTEIVKAVKPTQKGFTRTTHFPDSLHAEDINHPIPSPPRRVTNPLDPRYDLPSSKGYGFIEGSAVAKNESAARQNGSLKTEDIAGAKPKYNNFVIEGKGEIAGSKVGSLKRGVSSKRETNPLQPRYDYPGCSEVSQPSHFTRPKTAHQRFDQFIK